MYSMSNNSQTQSQCASRRMNFCSLGFIALAIAMVWSVSIAANTWREVRKRPDKNNIRITGSAKKRIVSDLIQWDASVEGRAADRTSAYKALREGIDKSVAFLISQGIKAEQIDTQATTIEEEFDTVTEEKVVPGSNAVVTSKKEVSKGFLATSSILVLSLIHI